jgi:hypothetical protein
VVDKKGHKRTVIIDIKEFNRLEHLLSPVDADSLVFEEKAYEESAPIEECNKILERVQQIKARG